MAPNATNATTFAPNTTTLAPNATNATTFAPNTTTFAPNPVPTMQEPNRTMSWAPVPTSPSLGDQQAMADRVSALFPSVTLSVTAYTLNNIDVATSLTSMDSIALLSYLEMDVLLAVIFGCDPSVPESVSSLAFDVVAKSISFVLPPAVLNSGTAATNPKWTVQYELCVGVIGSASSPVISRTSTFVAVLSLLSSLLQASTTSTLREQDVVMSESSLVRLPLASGSSFKTRRVSSSVLSGVAFAISAATREIGDACDDLSLTPGDSFVAGREIALVLTAEVKKLLWSSQKGVICASVGGSVSVAVSKIVVSKFAVISSQPIISVNRGGEVVSIQGIQAASLINGELSASSIFVSLSTVCNTPVDGFTALLRPVLGSNSSNVSQALIEISTVEYLDLSLSFFVCISWSNIAVPVTYSVNGEAIRVASPPPDTSVRSLVLVQGSVGWVDLTKFVLPAQDASQSVAVRDALTYLGAGGSVFFLPGDAEASISAKSAACAASGSGSIVMQVSPGGLLFVTSSQLPAQAILCSSATKSFLRVSSVVIENPTATLSTFNGLGFIAPNSEVDISGAIAIPSSGITQQLSLCFASSASSCTSEHTVPLVATASGELYGLIDSTMVLTSSNAAQELFVGTGVGSLTKAGAFVSTGSFVRITRFNDALSLWKLNIGLTKPWAVTSSDALCGSTSFPFALPVENGVLLPRSLQWPVAYSSAVTQMGPAALSVEVGGVTVPCISLEGMVFVFGPKLTESMCIPITPLRLMSSRVQMGVASVATLRQPLLTLQRSSLYSGLLVSLIAPNEATCSVAGVDGRKLMFSEYQHIGTSGIDLAPILWQSKFAYFKVCFMVSGEWVGPVAESYILTTFAPGNIATSWVNYIETIDAQVERALWQSQMVAWNVFGTFPSTDDTNVFVALVWDDPTCLSAPQNAGIVVPVVIVSNTQGWMSFDVGSIQRSGTRLFPCYVGDNSSLAWPMTLEAVFSRYFVIRPLIVSELQYQSSIAIGSVSSDVVLPLTDSYQAPVTRFSVYVASSATDYAATGDCSTLKAEHTAYFDVLLDVFGMRWMVVPQDFVTRRLPADSASHSFFVMCATASPQSSEIPPIYQQVTVSLALSLSSLVLPQHHNMLLIAFSGSVGAIVSDGTAAAYAASVVAAAAPGYSYSVVNASKTLVNVVHAGDGSLQLAIFIPATVTGGDVGGAGDLTNRVYDFVARGDCSYLAAINRGSGLPVQEVSLREAFNMSAITKAAIACGGIANQIPDGSTSYLIFCLTVVVTIVVLVVVSFRNASPVRGGAGCSSGSPSGASPLGHDGTTMKANNAVNSSVMSPSPRKPFAFEDEAVRDKPDDDTSTEQRPIQVGSPDKGLSTRPPLRIETPSSPGVMKEAPQHQMSPIAIPATQNPEDMPHVTPRTPSAVVLRAAPPPAAIVMMPTRTTSGLGHSPDDRDPLHDDDDSDEGGNCSVTVADF